MENFIPLEEGFTIFVSFWGKEFYNRRCWAILWMTGDHSPLCSDKLVSNLRYSQFIWRLCFFFFFLVLFCCQTACWESCFVCLSLSSHPRRAQWAPGVFKQQPEDNTQLGRAGERCTSSLQPYCPWGNCSLCWEMVMPWPKKVPPHQ